MVGLQINAQTFEYHKKKMDQYSKHKIVFEDKVFQEFLEQANLVNLQNCIGNITNEQMSRKIDSLLKASSYNIKKNPTKNDLYNYEVLRWRISEKCIKYKLANNIPFKEYEKPKDFYTKEERERIKNYEVIFDDKKYEKYAYALHNLQIKTSKDPLDSTDYSRDFKKIYRKLDQVENVSASDAHNFNMLMSKTSLIRLDYMDEQSKKIWQIKKQIRQLYAEKQ